MFTRTDMSPETREVMTAWSTTCTATWSRASPPARKKTPDEVRAIIDQGPFTATQALKAGLVDELRFEDEMWGELKDKLHSGDLIKVAAEKYLKVPPEIVGLEARAASRWWSARATSCAAASDDNGADESSLTSYGFDKLLRQVADDSTHQGRGRAHRFARRRGHRLRRDLARDEPAQQEEADW